MADTANAQQECAQASRYCVGTVELYGFDPDLSNVALCQGHLLALICPNPTFVDDEDEA